MNDFIIDTKVMLVAIIFWVALSGYSLVAHTGGPLLLLAQSADMSVLVWLTFRAWKRILR